jgi:methylmalonyl-CoA mutase C-terminal domain/subunit
MTLKDRVLLAKLGLDVHNRGIITVANILRNVGKEVIYIGNVLPDEIVTVAIQENADVIGVSSLGGAHLSLGCELVEKLREVHLREQIVLCIGGVIPPTDVQKLREIGFDDVFTPGATSEQIISSINESLSSRRTVA